jgi:hypothetical protein
MTVAGLSIVAAVCDRRVLNFTIFNGGLPTSVGRPEIEAVKRDSMQATSGTFIGFSINGVSVENI